MTSSIYLLLPAIAIGLIAMMIFDEAIKVENNNKSIYKWFLFGVGLIQGFLIGWLVTDGGVFNQFWIKLLCSSFAAFAWMYQPTRWRRMHKDRNKQSNK